MPPTRTNEEQVRRLREFCRHWAWACNLARDLSTDGFLDQDLVESFSMGHDRLVAQAVDAIVKLEGVQGARCISMPVDIDPNNDL